MIRLAVIGLDLAAGAAGGGGGAGEGGRGGPGGGHHAWVDAISALRAAGDIDLVAIGHDSAAAARQLAEHFKSAGTAAALPAFDDPRRLLQDAAPQALLIQRPDNISLDFLATCFQQNIAIFSLGPLVESLAEAQSLSAILEPRTHLLHTWPHFADSHAARRCAGADEFLRPIRFASATWLGINHARARGTSPAPAGDETLLPVRSLSVLAWDLLGTLITLMGVPTSVYAAIRGTVGTSNNFADISGAAAVTLRFPDDAAAALTICDHIPAAAELNLQLSDAGTANSELRHRRDLLLWGKGTLRVTDAAYEFRDESGKLIDAGPPAAIPAQPLADAPLFASADATAHARRHAAAPAIAALREFLHQYSLPPSPHRGRPHRLLDIAATLEAIVISHRTGQPESPDRLQQLRR